VPDRRQQIASGLLAAGALAAFTVGAMAVVGHFALFFGRLRFPLDLEWMEGGLLLHAYRYAHGQNIYVPPSLDFIPYLYTPLYPALLALLSKLIPLGYVLGRLLSIASFAAALALLVWAALRAAADFDPDARARARAARDPGPVRWPAWLPPNRAAALAVGAGAAGIVAASFADTGGFYDLVRADSLLIALEAGALFLALFGGGYRSAAAAGLLIALAFFCKQTASIVGLSLGAGLLVLHWRRGLVYGAVAAVALGAGLLALNATSHGWFWTYVFKLHQSHAFYARRAYIETPLHLFKIAGPLYLAWAMAGLALLRAGALERADALHAIVAAGGFLSACVGFGTQWAFDNAFIPAIYFPAFSAALWAARLAAIGLASVASGAAGAALAGVAGLVAVALGLQAMRGAYPDTRRFLPRARDRVVADSFLERIRALDGPLFIPFHPYYPVLAGRPPHLHRMGVWDVGNLIGRPAGLDEALAGGRFSYVILDYKSQPGEWPTLAAGYHDIAELSEGVDAVRSFSGAETSPRRLLARTQPPPPLPAGGVRLFDFESGYAGFTASGEAWGLQPAPAQPGLFGRAAADSRRFGPAGTGTLRSPPLLIDRPHLRFTLAGDKGPDLRVLLVDGAETSESASPDGGTRAVQWDVSRLRGRTVTLILEDRSSRGGLAVDEIVSF
jgi:hypothetical protein